MNKSLLFFILIFLSIQTFAQKRYCGFVESNNWLNPTKQEKMLEMEQKLAIEISKRSNLKTKGEVFKIPVVVHVVHNGESIGVGANISAEQVYSQIEVLNEDFRKLNADFSKVRTEFQAVAGDAEIEFVLATHDPDGKELIEPGINRYNGNKTSWSTGDIDNTLKPATSFDPYRYANFWTVKFSRSDLLGYAQFPNYITLPGLSETEKDVTDGVVMGYEYFGTSNTIPELISGAPYDLGRTTTHEVGHWLGLRHIWGDGGCGVDDFVDDTPQQASDYLGCPNATDNTCNSLDMWENFMDYTNDACMGLFSAQQVTRMRTVLEMDDMRDAMIKAETPSIEVPSQSKMVAFFQSENPERCTPSKINFNSSSYVLYNQSAGINLTWQFEGGTPSTASATNVEVEFKDFGVFDVQLIASSTAGSDTFLLEDYIKIEQPFVSEALTLPFSETFEGTPFDNLGWAEESIWEIASIGRNSSNSLLADNYDYDFGGSAGDIISPSFRLEGISNIEISFDLAYAPYSDTGIDEPFDSLAIYLGDGCGNKTFLWQLGGNKLATADSTESTFVPNASEWRQTSVLAQGISNFLVGRVYFSNIGYFGNNIYIDNVNIKARNDISSNSDLIVSPNPNDGNFSISLTNFTDFSDATLTVFNHLGIEVYNAFSEKFNAALISLPTLKNGIYIVRVETASKTHTKRIVVDK
ncbi:MAG: PKD repeat protein [Arenicella sp.]|jgi:PKD repeat protein